jgi:uncharacterized protein involved in response to NO
VRVPQARPESTVSQARSAAAERSIPDPYRVLFPIGLTWGLVGAGLWPLHALGLIAWPAVAHRMLMMQGFEQGFVLGFLLTAIPGFTHGERCRPYELAVATLSALGFGVAVLVGRVALAEGAFVVSVALLLIAVARRVARPGLAPPLEMVFVAFGLLLGLAGGLVQLAVAAGLPEPAPRFGERLISLGMVLSLVLGVGGLLVPVFAGMRDPLVIPGVAGPHERRGRRLLYGMLIAVFTLAFVVEWAGVPRGGAALRAAAASVLLLLVWKLWRLPGRRVLPAFVLWGSGWLILAGLWMMALVPTFTLGALHLVFIGGFAFLTMGIGTRVVVAHGHHPLTDESRTLTPVVVATVAMAILARLAAEWVPARATPLLGVSGAVWMLGWLLWAVRAVPRIARTRAAPVVRSAPTA